MPATMTRSRPKGRAAVAHGLREIYVAPAARERVPHIESRDEIETVERRPAGPFVGRIYFAWMQHDSDGGCDRDPVADPHEDLAYVGKTCRPVAARWAEHLVSKINRDGEVTRNNSAIYRHRHKLTGLSEDPRGEQGHYNTPEKLAAAEARAIKALWPAWNIQEQDRRNPHSRASRSYRRPDRLAPLIGLASVLWGLFWAVITGGLLYLAWEAVAAWYWIVACPFVALYITNGTMIRHARRLAWRGRRRRK